MYVDPQVRILVVMTNTLLLAELRRTYDGDIICLANSEIPGMPQSFLFLVLKINNEGDEVMTFDFELSSFSIMK